MTTSSDLLAVRVSDAMKKTKENHPEFDYKTVFIRLANGNINSLSSKDKSGNPVRQHIQDEQLTTLDYAKMLLAAHAAEQCILNYNTRLTSGDTVSYRTLRAGDVQETAQVLGDLCADLQNANSSISEAWRQAPGSNNQRLMEISENTLSYYYNPYETQLGNYLETFDQLFFENKLPSYANFEGTDLQSLMFSDDFRQSTDFSAQIATIETAAQTINPNNPSFNNGKDR